MSKASMQVTLENARASIEARRKTRQFILALIVHGSASLGAGVIIMLWLAE